MLRYGNLWCMLDVVNVAENEDRDDYILIESRNYIKPTMTATQCRHSFTSGGGASSSFDEKVLSYTQFLFYTYSILSQLSAPYQDMGG